MRPKARLMLTLLGGFDARPPAGAPLVLPTRKARALLGYLAVPLGRAHAREKLAALLWGDMPEAQARGNLRQALSRIQKAWARAAVPGLLFHGDTVALDPATVEVDVTAFERRLDDDRPAALEEAVERYRGDLLDGLALPERAFDEWLAGERERLRELAIAALGRLLAHQRAGGADEPALQTARRLLEIDPLQEAVHRLVMRLHWQHGRRAAALRQYQLCVEVLARELRAEPEPETRELHHEILRPPVASARSPVVTGQPAPVVGRGDQVETFRGLLDEVVGGDGRGLALIGEAGIGKSRLLDELAVLASERGARVLAARAHETERVLPFGVWVEALRAGGVLDDPEVLGELAPVVRRDLARLLPELGDGLRTGALPTNPLRLFTALARLVAAAGAGRPLAIVLDDVHWADEMSVRFLAFLGRRLGGSATLLAVSVRAESLADAPLLQRTLDELAEEARLASVDVPPLSPADMRRLIEQIVVPGPGPEARERLVAQAGRLAEGNPFVVLEAVRAWCAAGAPTLEALPLPERVRRPIVARLEGLDAGARQLAGVAAVIGRDVDVSLLLRASGLGDDEAVAGFECLLRAGIVRRDGERVGFHHERVREVAAGLLTAPRRMLLHRRVAENLEALSAPDHPPHRELGRHYRGGEVWDRALIHFRSAARLAAACGLSGEAVECYAEALAVARQPPSRGIEVARIDLQLELGSVLHNAGDVERALDHYREAEAEAMALGDPVRLAWTVAATSYAHTSLGHHRRAVELAQRALAIPTAETEDPALRLWVQHALVRTAYATGDYPACLALAGAALAPLTAYPADEPRGAALLTPVMSPIGIRGLRALALSALGQFDAALAEGSEAVRIAEKVNRSPELAWANYCLGRAALEQDNADQAVEFLERAFALTRGWEGTTRGARPGRRPLMDFTAAALGLAHATTGRLASAVGLCGAVGATNVSQFCFVRLLDLKGSVLVAAQRFDEALSAATRALETARAQRERGHEAWALRLLGEIEGRRSPGTVDAALGFLDQAAALADQLQMRPLLARCRLERAEVLYHAGRHDEARRPLTPAIEAFRLMAMKTSLRRAEALAEALGGSTFLRETSLSPSGRLPLPISIGGRVKDPEAKTGGRRT